MWSHYPGIHKGCCFEMQIIGRNNNGWKLTKSDYQDQLPMVKGSIDEKIMHILSVKDPIWKSMNMRLGQLEYIIKANLKIFYYFFCVKLILCALVNE